MRFFGYPYNDLVICKDSPDYLNKNYIFLKEIHQGFQICTQNLVPSNF